MEQMSLISKKKGERIDKFLGENLGDLSRSYIQKLLKDGLILVNGKKVKANYKLNEGDQIDVEVPDPEPLDIAAENRRKFALIHFAGSSECKLDIFLPGQYSMQDKLNAAETFLGGGTNFKRPLGEAIQLMDAGFENADIVFLTDGLCELPEDYLETLHKEQAARKFTVTGILLDEGSPGMEFSLTPFCQKIYRTSELAGDEIVRGLVAQHM